MLQEPVTSAYDLQFELLGYKVRVAWGFWLVAAILGWGWSGMMDEIAVGLGKDSPGAPALLLIWIAAIFLSILVHELGHSIAMSYYGTNSRIVLYHFGGLAIPDSFGAWNAARRRHIGPVEQIVISAAGPAFQLGLALVFIGAGYAFGIRMDLFGRILGSPEVPSSVALYALFDAILYSSIYWAILNLAPILPLDGGQIMRNVLLLTNVQQPERVAHIVSIGFGTLFGFIMMQSGNMAGLMFLIFAANNWQAMQFGSRGF